ncbi:MAG: DUF3429 domain-containing protein [Acetobacteraceae bacterium]
MRVLPFPAWWLGVGGLVPFAVATAVVLAGPPGWQAAALRSLLAYGAAILAFLGAVHWGLALGEPSSSSVSAWRLGLGVLPALIGWVALLLPATAAVAVLIVAFVSVWSVEEWASRRGLVPRAYLPLRRVLTGSVVALLASVLAARLS